MSKRSRFNNRELTNKLRELASEVHDVQLDEGGEAVVTTKGEALGEMLFQKALGHTETVIEEDPDTPGRAVERKVVHKPEAWAIQLIYDRLEGKTPQALPEKDGGLTAAQKVRELAIARVNRMTAEATGEQIPGPPKYRRKKDGDVT